MKLNFVKFQGAGNDFLIIDNRTGFFNGDNESLIEFLCHRRFGVGADGLMLLEKDDTYDFSMKYYNSDGREASMCGNGGRCIVAYANRLGLIGRKATFMAADGVHEAVLVEKNLVDLQMIDVNKIDEHSDGYFLNTGVPHLVHFVEDLNMIDVNIDGRQFRYDARFQPEGTNVNFVKQKGNHLTVYTYERGVESETLACGTGITASALSAAYLNNEVEGAYRITAKGGELEVRFKKEEGIYKYIWLKGPAEMVFEGSIDTANYKDFL